MEKAVISGKKIVDGGESFDMEGIVCVANTDAGTSISLRSGRSVVVADGFVTGADLC